MTRRIPFGIAAAVGASALVTAALTSAGAAAPAAGLVRVGSIASLTGSASTYGVAQAEGTALAAGRLTPGGRYRTRIVRSNDRSATAGAEAAMRAMIARKVGAVLGPTLSPGAQAADPIASAAGIPVLAVTNTTLDLTTAGATVWQICLTENQMISASVAYAHTHDHITTAAIVTVSGDGYATGAAQAFAAAAIANGITITTTQSVPTGTSVASAVANAEATTPEAIFFAARGQDATDYLTAAAGFAGTKVGGNGFNSASVITGAGAAANGLIVGASWNPGSTNPTSRAFVRAYRARYATTPTAFAAQAYGGMQIVDAAVRTGHGTSAHRIEIGLGRLTAVRTVLGTVRFSGHVAQYPATVQVVRHGQLVIAP